MKKITYKFLNFMYIVLLNTIPKIYLGDRLVSYLQFVIYHRRFPTNKKYFNDILYKIKTSKDIIDPLRIFVTDKEYVKLYIKAIVGDSYNVPTIDIIKNVKDVDNYNFPPTCCIKPTHASGLFIIRKNNEEIDKNLIKSWFKLNYYNSSREANYKNLKAKIIVEPLIFNETKLIDYKFFCYNGYVKVIQVDINRSTNHQRSLYSPNWLLLDFTIYHDSPKQEISAPENLNVMIEVAEKLSSHFSFIRVDMYSNGKVCVVGEITNCHASANQAFVPRNAEFKYSSLFFD